MNVEIQKTLIEEILGSIEVPDGAYKRAIQRYKDLGEWLGRDGSGCAAFDPEVYAQGSFRLGTVVRPFNPKDDYDLDVGCRLRQRVTKISHTQERLKKLVGDEVESYRQARRIENALKEKARCWRLQYKDEEELSFHMDVVPSIPEDARNRQAMAEGMIKIGASDVLARDVTKFAGAITDKTHPQYRAIATDWRVSNSQGYALWFEFRIRLAERFEKRALLEAKAAQVEPLSTRRWNSPLQQCVKILKRHRDMMFAKNLDSRPVSIVITTLSAAAYKGEDNSEDALQTILSRMGNLVSKERPRVVNPVNPQEDFADRWSTPRGRELELEKWFWDWLRKAQQDFAALGSSKDPEYLTEQAMTKFGAQINAKELGKKIGPFSIGISSASKGLASVAPTSPVDLRGGGRSG